MNALLEKNLSEVHRIITNNEQNVKEMKKLELLLDYEKRGLITSQELERLIDDQQVENSVSACCGEEVNLFGRCIGCGESN